MKAKSHPDCFRGQDLTRGLGPKPLSHFPILPFILIKTLVIIASTSATFPVHHEQ